MTASDKFGRQMSQRKQAADEGSGNDHPNSDAPIPANVVVTLSDNFINTKSVDTSGNEGGVTGGEGGLSSNNSYNIMSNRA